MGRDPEFELRKEDIIMASMLVFTLVFNVIGWTVFTLTDLFFGSLEFIHTIVTAEFFLLPIMAFALYRSGTAAGRSSDKGDRIMSMLIWFLLGAGVAGIVCKAVEAGRWFERSVFESFDYLAFATAFVLGAILCSVFYESVRFFAEGGFGSHRTAGGH